MGNARTEFGFTAKSCCTNIAGVNAVFEIMYSVSDFVGPI